MVDRNLFLRIISAIFILIICLLAVYHGPLTFYVFICSVAIFSAFEWIEITAGRKIFYPLALIMIALPNASLIYIYQMEYGLIILSWLVLTVWSIDIAAYFAGKSIGGWKICEMISPNKTWAGLVGGIIASLTMTLLMSIIFGIFGVFNAIIVGFIIAILEQSGDFSESFLKRLCNTKDSGTLIPGHGGIMDRVDGFIFTAPVVALYIHSFSKLFT